MDGIPAPASSATHFMPPITKLLIANRGEIALRVMRTAKRMGIRTVAVYSDADATMPFVAAADEAVRLGPAPAKESYLRGDLIIEAAKRTGAEAIHPGYGFLSENADFSDAVERAGLIFVGPPASAIRAMGLKDAAKALMAKAGVPVVPGYQGDNQDTGFLKEQAAKTGYPVMIKAVAGGGGKGMRRVEGPDDFVKALEGAQRESQSAFGDARVLIERYVSRPRHIEIQVFADSLGNAVHLFERDCSVQRRHQKVLEEAPAPGMTEAMRRAMGDAAVKAAKAIGYRGAGTVEFIVESGKGLDPSSFYFMEMNTRLQVEHPVTEEITGVDLVEWQIRVAMGEPLPRTQDALAICGHAIEVRLYAEDPVKGFLPSTGTLQELSFGPGCRIESAVETGGVVSIHYDPMIAKLIAHAPSRREAAATLRRCLEHTRIWGVKTNARFLVKLLGNPAFLSGDLDTGFIEKHKADLIDVSAAPLSDAVAYTALAEQALRALQMDASLSPWRDPFSSSGGWRLGRAEPERVLLNSGGESFETFIIAQGSSFSVTTGSSVADARVWAAVALREHVLQLDATLGGHRRTATVFHSGRTRVLWLDGASYEFTLSDPFDVELETASDELVLSAPMPGKVIQVLAKAGDAVRKGQVVAVLEAMKMEHALQAPADLTIEAVPFGPGDQVIEGATIVRFAKPVA